MANTNFLARFDMPWDNEYVQMHINAKDIERAKKTAVNYANLIARDLCNDPLANITVTLKEA